MRIGIIGGGYVGLHTAIRLAEVNHDWNITVLDIDNSKVNAFNKGNSPIDDYYMRNFLSKNYYRLDNIKYGFPDNDWSKYDLIFISLSTNPSRKDESRLNTKIIFDLAKQIRENRNIPVIIRSTLNIDDWKYLDKLNLCYWPEFLSQGVETERNINQTVNVISTDGSLEASSIFEKIFFGKTLLTASSKEAILAKVMHNTVDAHLITISNLFANISHENEIDFSKISPIVESLLSSRPKIKKAGIGYGGSCYPKDSYSLINITNRKEDKELIESLNNFNIKQANQFLLFENEIRSSRNLIVLGSSFKGGTNDITKTPTIALRNWLLDNKIEYKIWEPQFVLSNLLEGEVLSNSIEDDIVNADLVIVASDWVDFPELLKEFKGTVIDLKSSIPHKENYKLLRIGKK